MHAALLAEPIHEPTHQLRLTSLEAHLIARDIEAGFAELAELTEDDPALDPHAPGAAAVLFALAQWTDLGFRDVDFLDRAYARFDRLDRAQMPLLDFLRLTLVDAYRALARQSPHEAIASLDTVLRAGRGLLPPPMLFVVQFWSGRANRLVGAFDQAMTYIRAARATAQAMDAGRLVAVTKIHESWLAFHKGERAYAHSLLDEAEHELLPTGHTLSMGNIAAARGRFVRRDGDFTRALLHFEQAIQIYGQKYASHPNHARALVNAAYVKRLLLLELQPKMRGERMKATAHAVSLRIAREAMELLRTAGAIYALHRHQGGTGSVLVNMGYLQLESGDIDAAATEAAAAYELGEGKQDHVLMARARILQASVELAYSEEQLESEAQPEVALHAKRAVQHAEHAIQLAKHTQNKRLLAGAYIVRGLAAADDYFLDWEAAKEYAQKSAQLLGDDDRDHLFRELSGLKMKIMRSTADSEILRAWADGQVGSKTFQQIQEEFAEIVIPRVWFNLGRNVSQVAQQLSISPKKVRRILRNARYIATK